MFVEEMANGAVAEAKLADKTVTEANRQSAGSGGYKSKSPLSISEFQQTVSSLAKTPAMLAAKIWELLPLVVGPSIHHFSPIQGHPGTLLEIFGTNFTPTKEENTVTVGGESAYVLEASPTKLTVITSLSTVTGPVRVEVAGNADTGPVDFTVLPAPVAANGEDGPPIFYAGRGRPSAGAGPALGVSAQGTIQALVVLCNAQDRPPNNAVTVRNNVITEFDNTPVYYDQVSYGDTDLQLTYTDWVQLTGNYADYVDDSPDVRNFIWPADRILAEAAQGAVNQGHNLDDYIFMAVVLHLGGGFVRAWGGWSQSNFAWTGTDPNGNAVNINVTASHALGLTTIGENADWGRFAHELAHSLVEAGAVLGEDVLQLGPRRPGRRHRPAVRPHGRSRQPPLLLGALHAAARLLRYGEHRRAPVGPEPIHTDLHARSPRDVSEYRQWTATSRSHQHRERARILRRGPATHGPDDREVRHGHPGLRREQWRAARHQGFRRPGERESGDALPDAAARCRYAGRSAPSSRTRREASLSA